MGMMAAAATGEALNWWTDVVVPFGSALIGGGLAVWGATLGAKRAAKHQAAYARQIDRERRQSEALLVLDRLLNQLEYRARANEQHWERSPEAMNSNWDSTLTDHLNQIAADWPEVAPRVSDEGVRDAIVGFQAEAKASEVHEAQEERGRRQDRGSIDEARALNRKVLEDTRAVRSAIDDVL